MPDIITALPPLVQHVLQTSTTYFFTLFEKCMHVIFTALPLVQHVLQGV
jgi:hypothetical protein